MEKTINKLVNLAKAYRKFSEEYYGWNSKTYGKVWCYFASSGEHTSVHIDWIEVSFSDPPNMRFNNLGKINVEQINKTVNKYRKALTELKTSATKLTVDERNASRIKEINNLKDKIDKLNNKLIK